MTNEEKRQLFCGGCVNKLGVNECWSLSGATAVSRAFIHMDYAPPWNVTPEPTLDCHRRRNFVAVTPDHPQLGVVS